MLLVGSLALGTGCDDGGDGDGGGESGGDDRGSAILALDGDASAGQSLFAAEACSNMACHGADGTSGSATPSLDTAVSNASDAQIVNSFLNGKGSMPPQASYSDQQLADLLAYVSTFG